MKQTPQLLEEVAKSGRYEVKDTTPFAREKNNLTISAPIELIRAVTRESKLQGVDPYAGLAAAWKETLFGQRDPGGGGINPWMNPLQYNAKDLPPIPGSRRPPIDQQIDERLDANPTYKEALQSLVKAKEVPEKEFQASRLKAMDRLTTRETHIVGGINYLKKMLDEVGGNLQKAFARYRGKGQAARYHGRHVKALYEVLKKDPIIKQIVDEEG